MTLEVLVVEDDKMWQDLHKLILSKRDANATIVDNLESAVQIASKKKFDLYITDGSYPLYPNGFAEEDVCYTFYKRIKEINPEAKIVLISANYYDLSPKKGIKGMKYILKQDALNGIDELLKSMEAKT